MTAALDAAYGRLERTAAGSAGVVSPAALHSLDADAATYRDALAQLGVDLDDQVQLDVAVAVVDLIAQGGSCCCDHHVANRTVRVLWALAAAHRLGTTGPAPEGGHDHG